MEYSTQQAAAKLKCSLVYIRKLVNRGHLKARLAGPRFMLVDGKSLERFIRNRRKPGRPTKARKAR